jgi:hypothetical protein
VTFVKCTARTADLGRMEITGSVQMQASIYALKASADAPARQAEQLLQQAVEMSRDMLAQAAGSSPKLFGSGQRGRGIDLRA